MERRPLYHIAPRAAREAIRRDGLTVGNPAHFVHATPTGSGSVLFVWGDFLMASRWRARYPFPTDFWVIEGDGIVLADDPDPKHADRFSRYTDATVEPSRLRLLEAA